VLAACDSPESDQATADRLSSDVAAEDLPLSDRLSVFWSSRDRLRAGQPEGRFPPLDRLDLIRYGRLLAGNDARDGFVPPSQRELVLAAARMAAGLVRREAYQTWFANPAALVAAGPKPLTKAVLFPVRFLYTARTGEIGRNHDAVAHFVATETGPMADLAAAALRWRETPPGQDRAASVALVAAGIKPLYRHFAADHEQRLRDYDEPALATRYAAWRAALAAS